jgi:Predicted nucleotide-binding protein containing TIR-like domain
MMIEGKPTVFVSHSEAAKGRVAGPFKEFVDRLGLYGVLVGDEALPEPGATDPGAKVNHFLDDAQMFVALATADDRTEGGEVHTRPNVILEIGAALERPHLARRVQVFKAAEVQLPSNINPIYEALDPEHIEQTFVIFERQARTWGLLARGSEEAPPTEPAAPEDVPAPGSNPHEEGQGAVALVELASVIGGEQTERAAPVAARAHLAASAALAARRSSELLGVHEINGLYRDRASVVPDGSERRHLLRTIIGNVGAANAPGWYWLRGMGALEVRAQVSMLAMSDTDSKVTREAVNLLLHSRTPPPSPELRGIVRTGLREDSGNVDTVLKLLKHHGTRSDLRALASSLESHGNAEAVNAARLAVQSKAAPQAALRTLIESPELIDPAIEEHLLSAARSLPEATVRRALRSPVPALRTLALRALHASSRLRKADVEAAIEGDSEGAVRFLAADLAIKRRWSLNDEQFDQAIKDAPWSVDRNRLAVRFFGLRSAEEMLQGLSWYSTRGSWIYEALGRWHFDRIQPQIEADLKSNFGRLRESDNQTFTASLRAEVVQKFERRYGAPLDETRQAEVERQVDAALEKRNEDWAEVEDFILRRFRIAALSALAANPSPGFAHIGRQHLGDSDREAVSLAVKILRRCGSEKDVAALISLCASSWGELRVEAALAALDLAGNRRDVALELLAVEDAAVVQIALQGLGAPGLDHEIIEATLPLLNSEHLSIREVTAGFLITHLARGQLTRLLDIYAEGHYYYSVMARIDRELYAPGWVKQSASAIFGQ